MNMVKVLLLVVVGMRFLIVFILNCIGNKKQNWIKISDKLPQRKESELYSERVLLFSKCSVGSHILIGSYWVNRMDNSVHWVDDTYDDEIMVNGIVITHWMPLPDRPEGKSKC